MKLGRPDGEHQIANHSSAAPRTAQKGPAARRARSKINKNEFFSHCSSRVASRHNSAIPIASKPNPAGCDQSVKPWANAFTQARSEQRKGIHAINAISKHANHNKGNAIQRIGVNPKVWETPR